MTRKVRQIRIVGNIAYVPLTQGCEAIIDAEDVPNVDGFNWYAKRDSHTFYAVRAVAFPKSSRRQVLMHRAVYGLLNGAEIDHIDGNGLNNTKRNLRSVTVSENSMNRGLRSDNTSGFKGVTLHKPNGKWRARIMASGKAVYLGNFHTAEAAHEAYCMACDRLHGEFGRTK